MQRKLIIEAFGLPELLMIAAQMLMVIRTAPLAQNPLLPAGVQLRLRFSVPSPFSLFPSQEFITIK